MLPILLAALAISVDHVTCQIDQAGINYIGRFLNFRFQILDNNGDTSRMLLNLTNNGDGTIVGGAWSIYFDVIRGVGEDQLGVGLQDQGVRLDRVHGPLYRLSPTSDFFSIVSGGSRVIEVDVLHWMSSRYDVMPNAYVSAPALTPRVLENTRSEGLEFAGTFSTSRQWKRNPWDNYNPLTPPQRYERNRLSGGARRAPGDEEWRRRVIPQPLVAEFDTDRNVTIDGTWGILAGSDVVEEANFLGGQLVMTRLLSQQRSQNVITMRTGVFEVGNVENPRLFNNSDAYRLTTDQETHSIEIVGRGPSGVFYGMQTLLALLDGGRTVPQLRILDAPRFRYRGMHLDVSRNFHRKQEVKRLLGAMSVYKMNKFHFHLSDDQGWRLEIPGLPELTQVGAQRCHDLTENDCLLPEFGSGPDTLTSGTGFYSVADYREILAFARQRHIEVIPEIDMPGHSRAAIRSMDRRLRNLSRQRRVRAGRLFSLHDERSTHPNPREHVFHNRAINPCIPSTYRFVEHIVDALIQMHRDFGGLRVFHFGGDEVAQGAWNHSVTCQALRLTDPVANVSLARYFANRVSRITADRNLTLAGWEDGLVHNKQVHNRNELVNNDVMVYPWNNPWDGSGHNNSYILANAGFQVVMSQATHLYFDHPHEEDPEERGLVWATRFIDTKRVFGFSPLNMYANIDVDWNGEPLTRRDVCGPDGRFCVTLRRPENIIGMQGQVWTELIRTADQLDYMIFPRLLALAERAWHEASWERMEEGPQRVLQEDRDWNSFIRVLGDREIRRMDQAGVRYRIPPPGARFEGSLLLTNNLYPGLPVQYRLDNTLDWRDFTSNLALAPNQTVALRSRSHDGRRFSRPITFNTTPVTSLPYVVQSTVEYIAEFLQINLTIVDNLSGQAKVDIVFRNVGNQSIPATRWEIYFTSVLQVFPPHLLLNPAGHVLAEHCLRFTHIAGSLFKIEPVKGFRPLREEESRTVRVVFSGPIASRSLVMPNWYVTGEGMLPLAINATKGNVSQFLAPFREARQWKLSSDDSFNPFTMSERYDRHSSTKNLGQAGEYILPTPLQSNVDPREILSLSECCWTVVTDPTFEREAQFLIDTVNMTSVRRAWTRSRARTIELRTGDPAVTINGQVSPSVEAYLLTVDPRRQVIEIVSRDPAGIFYGIQSLLSLGRGRDGLFTGELPRATVRDAPRFQHRGILMDVSRNFRSKEEVMLVLDMMATYKLNKLHFHLSDDEGWRLEIPGLPELTRVSSRRCHDLVEQTCLLSQLGSGADNSTSGSGFYSVDDYREIVRYATDRHVEIIEEFDTPGHSRAQIVAMKERQRRMRNQGNPTADNFLLDNPSDEAVYTSVQMFHDNMVNPCLESTYTFFSHVLQEIQTMRRDIAPMRNYFFVGGEVREEFVNSTACRARGLDRNGVRRFYAQRISQIAANLNIRLSGWSDGFMGTDNRPLPRLGNIEHVGVWDNLWSDGRPDWAHRLANAGYRVVLGPSTHLFFDHPEEPDPEENGFFWATRYTDTQKVFWFQPDDLFNNTQISTEGEVRTGEQYCAQHECERLRNPQNIIGIQAQMFAEVTRTGEQQQQLLFPRLLALAERAWHKASWESIENEAGRNRSRLEDWGRFANTLSFKELPFLDRRGVAYRIPPPGAKTVGWSWWVNTQFPGMTIEVSFNNGNTWQRVRGQQVTSTGRAAMFRTRSAFGDRYSRVVSSSSSVSPTVVISLLIISLHVML